MRLVSWNEKDLPDLAAWQVEQDARTGRKKFGGSTLIGLQEIGEPEDHSAFRRAFKKPFTEYFKTRPIPIIANSRYMGLNDLRYIKVHDGIAHRTPHRGYVRARVHMKLRPYLKPFYVINTHMISSPQKDDAGRRLWAQHWKALQDEVARLNGQGYDVFILGDLNRTNLPSKIHEKQQVIAHHLLDYILYVPGSIGNTVSRKGVQRVYQKEFYTDHAVLEVIVKLGRRK